MAVLEGGGSYAGVLGGDAWEAHGRVFSRSAFYFSSFWFFCALLVRFLSPQKFYMILLSILNTVVRVFSTDERADLLLR